VLDLANTITLGMLLSDFLSNPDYSSNTM